MKKKTYRLHFLAGLLYLLFCGSTSHAQEHTMELLRQKLEAIYTDSPGLLEKTDVNINHIPLPDFLRTLANAHHINLSVDPALNDLVVTGNFTNTTVKDILLFICKSYQLTIDFTGNVCTIQRPLIPKSIAPKRKIPLSYDPVTDLLSINLQKDSLYLAFKEITDKTQKNLVFEPGLEHRQLSGYIRKMPLESALDKLAFANDLSLYKTADGVYLFQKKEATTKPTRMQRPRRNFRSPYRLSILDTLTQQVAIDIEQAPVSDIIRDLGDQLGINLFTSTPLNEAGAISFKAESISFDQLLTNLLENTAYTYKKEGGLYYFGKKQDPSVRSTELIPLRHRSIEIMANKPSQKAYSSKVGSTNNPYGRPGPINQNTNASHGWNVNMPQTSPSSHTPLSNDGNQAMDFLELLPAEVTRDLDIKTDSELNSFIVNGPAGNIQKFKDFIAYIDKPVPVISIEIMILEMNRKATVESGISWGIGETVSATKGLAFPSTDISIGSADINQIIGNNKGFGALNLGKVLPEFYMNIKALEDNGNIKVRSTPKLATLNGHRSKLSIGETTYYVVTDRSFVGSQIPQTSEIKNYQPINAELSVELKPLVSGDGQITMEVRVLQSSFNGERVDQYAPPGINSREFTSIVRVKNQELIVLGGLEEKVRNDSGSGIPVLARIPLLKWFFSKRKRENSKKRLVLFIKPTVIY